MREKVIFILKSINNYYKKTTTTTSHHYGLHFKEFYGHCDINDCGSFGLLVRGSPKPAEDHCERVETRHLQPMRMLDK